MQQHGYYSFLASLISHCLKPQICYKLALNPLTGIPVNTGLLRTSSREVGRICHALAKLWAVMCSPEQDCFPVSAHRHEHIPLHLSQGNVPTAQEEITKPFSVLQLSPSRNPHNSSAAKMNLPLARESVLCLLHTKFVVVFLMTQECCLAPTHDVHCLCPCICYLINYICT